MSTKTKHLFSVFAVIIFIVMAVASKAVKGLPCNSFNTSPTGEDFADQRKYVELNDGKKIYGEKIVWTTGLVVKDQIKIDGQAFPIKETRGYYTGGAYYGRWGSSYVRRIIHGKINVYYSEEWRTHTDSKGHMQQYLACGYYVQKGESEEPVFIHEYEDIKKFVSDCPASMALLDKSNKDIRKAVKKNFDYLNRVFFIYNDNCKE